MDGPKSVPHSRTIRAHSCPLWTAPSIVAGNPVAVQSPARKKLLNRVRLEGRNVVLALPVTPWEAALGVQVEVPTLGGAVQMTIP